MSLELKQVGSELEGFDSLVAIQPSNRRVGVSRTGTTDGSKLLWPSGLDTHAVVACGSNAGLIPLYGPIWQRAAEPFLS
jgi:hypothetical protein